MAFKANRKWKVYLGYLGLVSVVILTLISSHLAKATRDISKISDPSNTAPKLIERELDLRNERLLETGPIVGLPKKLTKSTDKKTGINETYQIQLGNALMGYFKAKIYQKRAHLHEFEHEISAYILDRILGFGLVPVTVSRKIQLNKELVEGSLQMHHKGWEAEGKSHTKSPRLLLLDYIMSNCDRISGRNLIINNEKEVAIDNGLAFQEVCGSPLPKEPPLDLLEQIDKVPDDILKAKLDLLTEQELSEVIRRKNCAALLYAEQLKDPDKINTLKAACGVAPVLSVAKDDSRVSHEFNILGDMIQVGKVIWSGVSAVEMSQRQAEKFCRGLGRGLGERAALPTRQEYQALARAMGRETYSGYKRLPGMGKEFWSSSHLRGSTSTAYYFYGVIGSIEMGSPRREKGVRCVTRSPLVQDERLSLVK